MTSFSIWPSQWPQDLQHLGLLGDYIGGVWGTGISVLTLVVVFVTWRLTRQSSRKSGAIAVLTEMLKTHDSITSSPSWSSSNRGGVPGITLREFAAIYRLTRRVVTDDQRWPINTRIDIAYTYTFYGLNSQAKHSLDRYGANDIKKLQDAVSKLRDRAKSKYSGLFVGHQHSLSHYVRNLFSMYNFIESLNLSLSDKLDLAKIVRSKLSNYDQALVALNVISHLGAEWESLGLVEKYKPFANVPKLFFGFDPNFSLKARFPNVQFEWERINDRRPKYFTLRIGHRTATLAV